MKADVKTTADVGAAAKVELFTELSEDLGPCLTPGAKPVHW